MADINIHWAEFESGQEPQDAVDDDFATSFDVEFTLSGRALAQMLGVQARVLDRAIEKLDSKMALRRLKSQNKTLKAVIRDAAPDIKRTLEDHAYDIGADGMTITVIEPDTDGRYWEATVDKRKGAVKYLMQVSVMGDWDPSGRGKYASSDRSSVLARRVASKWAGQREAINVRRSDDVGRTILQQLGGSRRLTTMIGAKNFIVGHKDGGSLGGLSFKFPRPGKGKPNFVKVLLMPDDTYTVEFMSLHGYTAKLLKKFDGIYADALGDLFTRTTGLYLRL